jgi:hypothetical protein
MRSIVVYRESDDIVAVEGDETVGGGDLHLICARGAAREFAPDAARRPSQCRHPARTSRVRSGDQ